MTLENEMKKIATNNLMLQLYEKSHQPCYAQPRFLQNGMSLVWIGKADQTFLPVENTKNGLAFFLQDKSITVLHTGSVQLYVDYQNSGGIEDKTPSRITFNGSMFFLVISRLGILHRQIGMIWD